MKTLQKFIEERGLLFVVFITGACVLVLEVVATRVLSPYYGNTIFNYSSVIGIVLAALSFGYYFGGKYADKYPSTDRFYRIIMYSGFSTLLIKILMVFVLPYLGKYFSIITGPVVSSLALFTLPCFLMGTLSPYAIKLQEKKFTKKGIGNLSGEVFFASTLGSIFGSFLTGFYLIPTFGISDIVIGVGVILFITGFLGITNTSKFKKKVFFNLIVFFILLALSSVNEFWSKAFIFFEDGLYEKIGVLNMEFNGKQARLLFQDRSFSSGIDINDKNSLLFDYTKYINLYKLVNPDPRNALFIGGGAYSMPYYLIKNIPKINVDVAEIEPKLYPLAKKYFGVTDNKRLKNHIEDGRRYLYDSEKSYDIIFSDVYGSVYSIPPHFTTKEFFYLAQSKLSPKGIFLVNIISDLSKTKPSLLYSELKTFSEVFDNSYFFAVDSPYKSGAQNIILMGINNKRKIDLDEIVVRYYDDEILKNLSLKLIDLSNINLNDYPTMTDDYSPAEYLTSKLFVN